MVFASRVGQRACLHWLLREAGLLAPPEAESPPTGSTEQPRQQERRREGHREKDEGAAAVSVEGGDGANGGRTAPGGGKEGRKKEGALSVLTMTREALLLAVLEAAVLSGEVDTMVEVREDDFVGVDVPVQRMALPSSNNIKQMIRPC
jgi:hypothetical protein